MKKLFIAFFCILNFLCINISRSDNQVPHELIFRNSSPTINYISIKVTIYPISMIFNGNRKYDLRSKINQPTGPRRYDYDACIFIENNVKYNSIIIPPLSPPLYNEKALAFDLSSSETGAFGAVAFGKYKILISDNAADTLIDSCTIEFDNGYPNFSPDIFILFNNANDKRISFFWGSDSIRYIDAPNVNRKLESWNQYGLGSEEKNWGDFYYDSFNNNNYGVFPQDSRIDCNSIPGISDQNQVFTDSRSGVLTLNLTIDKNIFTRDTLIDEPTNIVITKKAALKINSNKTFDMITPISSYNNLIVEDTAYLVLYSSAKINVFSPNKITLKNKSNLTLGSNSEIRIKDGAAFNHEGGNIRGPGKIIFENGIHYLYNENNFFVKDSTQIILEDSAVVIVPNNYNLHIRGNTTSLIMKPGSKMMFGENSGIVCDSGAKVIANNAVFTSADSAKKWNGITLKHRSQDTIKNCIIKNADFGISIMNKNDDEGTEIPFLTEISGCSFINMTSHVLNSGIYAAGSSKLLISNNV